MRRPGFEAFLPGEQEDLISEPIDVAPVSSLTIRLRDLAHQRAGCAALFEGERQARLGLASLNKAIMVEGWLELFRKGGSTSQPTTRVEREALQVALERQRDQRRANMLLTPGYVLRCTTIKFLQLMPDASSPRYAARNPEMYRKMHQRFVIWAQGAPIPSLNGEDAEDGEASDALNESEVEGGHGSVEDGVNVVPAPVH